MKHFSMSFCTLQNQTPKLKNPMFLRESRSSVALLECLPLRLPELSSFESYFFPIFRRQRSCLQRVLSVAIKRRRVARRRSEVFPTFPTPFAQFRPEASSTMLAPHPDQLCHLPGRSLERPDWPGSICRSADLSPTGLQKYQKP